MEEVWKTVLLPGGGNLCAVQTHSLTVRLKCRQCPVWHQDRRKKAALRPADSLRHFWDNKVNWNASNTDETELMCHDRWGGYRTATNVSVATATSIVSDEVSRQKYLSYQEKTTVFSLVGKSRECCHAFVFLYTQVDHPVLASE